MATKTHENSTAISTTVQELAKSLLHDLEHSPSLQLSSSLRGDSIAKDIDHQTESGKEAQWTLVTRHSRSSSPKRSTAVEEAPKTTDFPSGFRVLQIEGEEDEGLNSSHKETQVVEGDTSKDKSEESGAENYEADGKEEGEIEDQITEVTEKKVSETSLADHDTRNATKVSTGRNRSRSRGPPKPITQRRDNGGKGNKNASLGKL